MKQLSYLLQPRLLPLLAGGTRIGFPRRNSACLKIGRKALVFSARAKAA
jgi:hypothetical protein